MIRAAPIAAVKAHVAGCGAFGYVTGVLAAASAGRPRLESSDAHRRTCSSMRRPSGATAAATGSLTGAPNISGPVDLDGKHPGPVRKAHAEPPGDRGKLGYAGLVQAGCCRRAQIGEPDLDDRARRAAARADRVGDHRAVIPGEDLKQCQARGGALHDIGTPGQLPAQRPHREHADGVIAGVLVAEAEDERSHGQSRRISCRSAPPASRSSTISGMWPGRLCVEQPMHGS